MTNAGGWWSWSGNDLRLQVLVQTRASRDGVGGIHGDRLRLRVKAAPVGNRANDELVAWLAKEFGVPRKNVELLAGQSGKRKTLLIGTPTREPQWFAGLGGATSTAAG